MIDILLQNKTLVLFLVISLGISLGSIKLYGMNLGLSGVLFIALLAGYYQLSIPQGVGQLGLALFVYCVGLSAGNRFFSAFAKQGYRLALLSLLVVGACALFTYIYAVFFDIPTGIAAGVFAGACTSTPALAAATESLPLPGGVGIGYGVAYPFGVIGVVLFVQLLPRLLRKDLNEICNKEKAPQDGAIMSRLVRITQPKLFGQMVGECTLLGNLHGIVTRMVKDGRLTPLSSEDIFQEGSEVLLIGHDDTIERDIAFLGEACEIPYPIDSQKERRELILTNKHYAGAKLRDLDLLRTHRVVISRISRFGFTFVPDSNTTLERNDILTVVGTPDNITAYGKLIGHRDQQINQTDLLSLGFGLSLGIILGLITFSIGHTGIALGMAGGPLIVALILGHFGRVGPVVGYIPRPTRLLLQDLGLVFFLADAGIKGGTDMFSVLATHGVSLFIMGLIVTCSGMLLGYFLGMKVFKMNLAECLGGICGAMTSTPALGAITTKTDSQIPVVSYVTAYPIALILMTVITKIIIQLLSLHPLASAA